jgi:hypothetical protein
MVEQFIEALVCASIDSMLHMHLYDRASRRSVEVYTYTANSHRVAKQSWVCIRSLIFSIWGSTVANNECSEVQGLESLSQLLIPTSNPDNPSYFTLTLSLSLTLTKLTSTSKTKGLICFSLPIS